jgi:hypothetical protein
VPDRPLAPVTRRHLDRMTGPLGIWQHADGTQPDPDFGTCTDDVARALTVDLLHRHTLGWEAVAPDARRSLAYLAAAFDPATGGFHDFRDATGAWLDDVGSQDCQGRALTSLGIAAREAPEVAMRGQALALLVAALPGAARLTSPRAVASAILGCEAALDGDAAGALRPVFRQLVERLVRAFDTVDLDGDWRWPEEVLAYENALLPRALIVAGRRLADPDLRRRGLAVLDWLIEIQTSRRGLFTPIGNDGWWPRGLSRSQWDQQPIEATALILACTAAFEVTEDAGYRRAAEAAYGWFLGDNEAGLVVADVVTGGCHDGLEKHGVNLNQGAESTLMWLTAVEAIRALRTRASARARRSTGVVPVVSGVRS